MRPIEHNERWGHAENKTNPEKPEECFTKAECRKQGKEIKSA